MVKSISDLDEKSIIQSLGGSTTHSEPGFNPCDFLSGSIRPAAVLIPLVKILDSDTNQLSWHILYTRRSDTLEEHSGQVSFPGGRADPNDSTPESTALREAYEEIGIFPQDVHILGRLDRLATITNYCVTPVVGLIPWPYTFQLAQDEVSRVFTIPLHWLADVDHYELCYRDIPPEFALIIGKSSYPVIHYHPFDGEILWGVSAEITCRLIQILVNS
jgi:8-oxo-dGTP pyrophosphatase MutT (NUDIX family)